MEERAGAGVDAPGGGAAEEAEQVVEVGVEVVDRDAGEDVLDDGAPPGAFAAPDLGRSEARKRQGGAAWNAWRNRCSRVSPATKTPWRAATIA